VDIFPSPFEFEIRSNKTKHSTVLGGLYTVAIVILSLIFAILKLVAWFRQEYEPLIITDKQRVDLDRNIPFHDLEISLKVSYYYPGLFEN
jgi:uncharacterized membrane protein YdbT with pleckstrin-like domain